MTATNTPTGDEPIFHLAIPSEWAAAFADGEYRSSTRGTSLEQVGFIHCSTRDQIEATANRFYGDLEHLVLLTIDQQLVPSEIRFEAPEPHSELLFPHIYGPLPVSAVNLASSWTRAAASWSLATL